MEPGLHIRRDASRAATVSRDIYFPPAGADPEDHPIAFHGGAPGPWLRLQCFDSAESWVQRGDDRRLPAGHSRRWTPSCRQTPPQKPWTSSSDSWRLLRTSALVQSRRCNTPTCRDSIAPTASGHGSPTCGSRCTKETSSLHQSIANACTRCWSCELPSSAFHGHPRPQYGPRTLQRPQYCLASSERPSHPADYPGAKWEQPQPSRGRPGGCGLAG